MKAWEDKHVLETSLINKAVYNAEANVNRKKGKRAIPLWKSKPKKVDKKAAVESHNIVNLVEMKEGKSWVDKIYKANGRRLK